MSGSVSNVCVFIFLHIDAYTRTILTFPACRHVYQRPSTDVAATAVRTARSCRKAARSCPGWSDYLSCFANAYSKRSNIWPKRWSSGTIVAVVPLVADGQRAALFSPPLGLVSPSKLVDDTCVWSYGAAVRRLRVSTGTGIFRQLRSGSDMNAQPILQYLPVRV